MQRSVDGSASEHPDCLDEQEVVDFAAGLLPTEKIPLLEEHLSGCERCTSLIAAAAPHVGLASATQVTQSIDTQPFGPQHEPPHPPGRDRPLLAAGTPLDATYQVVRFLGRGGMGDVYEVKHARLAGRYAAKLLSSDLVTNVQAFSRFQREAMIASGLSHPNIVNVIDFCHLSDGLPCLVMEFLNGNDLAQLMAPGPLSLQRTLRLVRQIVSALGTLHGHQIIHRDLKPQNIFVLPETDGEPERVKLVDFGLAKRSNPSMVVTHDRTLLGTPQYMAPEQAVGNADSVGAESDQFSLAAIVYEMLGGRHPFGGEVLSTVLYRIVHEPPAPLTNLAPHLPAHVVAAIERGLSKNRQDRFPSVKAFLQALEGEGIAMTPAPIEKKQRRSWFIRREVLVSAGVLAAGIGIVALVRTKAPPPEPPAGHATTPARETSKAQPTPAAGTTSVQLGPSVPGDKLTIERGPPKRATATATATATDTGAPAGASTAAPTDKPAPVAARPAGPKPAKPEPTRAAARPEAVKKVPTTTAEVKASTPPTPTPTPTPTLEPPPAAEPPAATESKLPPILIEKL